MTQNSECDKRNQKASNEKSNTVDGIRYRDCLQTAEDRVAGADNTNDDTENGNCHKLISVK